jgi:hypothetical protein
VNSPLLPQISGLQQDQHMSQKISRIHAARWLISSSLVAITELQSSFTCSGSKMNLGCIYLLELGVNFFSQINFKSIHIELLIYGSTWSC